MAETLQVAVERVTHNTAIDEQAFHLPVPATEPPIDIEGVLSAAVRSAQRANVLHTAYGYTRATSSGRMDERGQITHREGATYEVVHFGDGGISKLIRKDGGEPLSEAERQREDER